MSFGFGFGFTKITAAIRAAFSPSSLFSASEPGVWYDPSDLSTLYQDAAGTTPVTAVEQPVGLMLDKSKGLVLGPELVTNGDFTGGTTGWVGFSATLSIVSGKLRITSTGTGYTGAYQVISGLTPGATYKVAIESIGYGVSVYDAPAAGTLLARFAGNSGVFTAPPDGDVTFHLTSKLSGGAIGDFFDFDNISVRELPGNHASQPTATSRPVLSARVNQYLATETLATQNITTLAAQYRLSFEGTGTVTLSGTATGVYSAGSHLITCTAGTLTSTVSGSVTKADLRVANTGVNLPLYQRVNTSTDYDTVGFPHYLRFDGVDDWLVTPTITPNTDKAQVFAGVRKLSDAARGIVAELGISGFEVGSWNISAPVSSTPGYAFRSVGNPIQNISYADVTSGYSAPITNVLTGLGDIAGDNAEIRINGTQAASNTADQGTGNFLAYPLYIGRRGGTTLPFNGRLYGLIVRFGSNLPAATIENTEKYINSKTKAY